MKINNRTRGIIVIFTPFIIGLLLGLLIGKGCTSEKHEAPTETKEEEEYIPEEIADLAEPETIKTNKPAQKEVIYGRKRLKYKALFNDINEEHLSVAKKVGLQEPPQTRAEISGNKKLVRIKDNDLYKLFDLKYSSPYLTKGAATELEAISQAFKDSLSNKHLLNYRLLVTSVLRSNEDVRNLRKSGNANASMNSAHCYGTTFDIAYTRYDRDNDELQDSRMQPFELTKVLGEVLLDRKKAGKCLVKYEQREHCFHITATY